MKKSLKEDMKKRKEEGVKMKENTTSFWKMAKSIFYVCLFCMICMIGIRVSAAEDKAAVSLQEPVIVSVNAPADVTTALRVTWNPVPNADGYIIYRKDEASSQWVRIKKVAGQARNYYSNVQLQPGSKYTYTVQSFCQVNGKVYYSTKGTKPVSAVTHLKTPALKSATSASYNQIKVVWTPVTNAQGYRIYRKEAGTGWKLIRRIAGEKKYFCIDSTAETGKQYYYTVRATCSHDGKLYLSGYNTKGIAGKAMLGTSAITSIKASGGQVTLTWKQIPGAQGYVVMRSTTPNGTYKKIRTAQGVSDTSYTDKQVTSGSTYYYKVRAFKQVDGKFVYGAFSPAREASLQAVEIMDYISMQYNNYTLKSDLIRLANAIGNMTIEEFDGLLQIHGGDILIQYKPYVDPNGQEVNLMIQNGGDEGVTLHGNRIGDTLTSIRTKLEAKGFEALPEEPSGFFNVGFLYRDGSIAIGTRIIGGRMQGYKLVQLDPSQYSAILSTKESSIERWRKMMQME